MGQRREIRGRRKNDKFPGEAVVSRRTVSSRTILTVVFRDITDRKELEDLRDAVGRELDQRMRNVLTIVNSLVSLSAASARNVEEFRDSLTGRLSALAATQGALRFGEGQSTSLSELFQAELRQYQIADGANLIIEGPPVSVGPKAAQILALAIHELAINSAKYGSLGHAGGRVTVALAYEDEEESMLVIEWRETGGPPVHPPTRQEFSTSLLKKVVARALRADVAMEFRPEGLVCRMTLPRATVEAAR